MKAVRYYGPGQINVEDLPQPQIAEGEVLIAMKACGICGTDIKTYVRGHPMIPSGAVLGHEVAGVVAASEHPGFKSGDRVVAAPYAPCLSCPMCQSGHYSLCEHLFESALDPGGFSEMIRVPKRIADQALLQLPDELDFATASLTEPLACCIHGLETLNLQAGQSLLIIGDGPMGMLQAILGKSLGAAPVIMSGLIPDRLRFAARVADLVIDASNQKMTAAVKATLPNGPDKVMVSAGSVDVLQEALELVRKGGTVNIFAGMPKDSMLMLPVNRIHYDEIAVLGTFGFGPQHFRKALDFLSRGELPAADIFTRVVGLDEIEEAIQTASRYEGIKTLVVAD